MDDVKSIFTDGNTVPEFTSRQDYSGQTITIVEKKDDDGSYKVTKEDIDKIAGILEEIKDGENQETTEERTTEESTEITTEETWKPSIRNIDEKINTIIEKQETIITSLQDTVNRLEIMTGNQNLIGRFEISILSVIVGLLVIWLFLGRLR